MGKTTKVDREKIKGIQKALHRSADDLRGASLDQAGPSDFGGSTTGQTLGDDVLRARHHVLETGRKMAGGVGGFAVALDHAVKYVDETEDQVQTDVGAIDSSVTTIGTRYDDPSSRQHPKPTSHGRPS